MRPHATLVALLAFAGASSLASAAPCYVIYDRNDAVIFRDYSPPFDLSDPKAPERQMMRQQGQHLLIAEFDNCNPVGFISPTTGSNAATVDEIVAGVQPAIATSIAKSGGVVQSGAQPGARAPARGNVAAPARSAPATRGY